MPLQWSMILQKVRMCKRQLTVAEVRLKPLTRLKEPASFSRRSTASISGP
jgi:hypothetical protein